MDYGAKKADLQMQIEKVSLNAFAGKIETSFFLKNINKLYKLWTQIMKTWKQSFTSWFINLKSIILSLFLVTWVYVWFVALHKNYRSRRWGIYFHFPGNNSRTLIKKITHI